MDTIDNYLQQVGIQQLGVTQTRTTIVKDPQSYDTIVRQTPMGPSITTHYPYTTPKQTEPNKAEILLLLEEI